MIFVGLDLHKRHIRACAIDAVGQLIAEERRVSPDLGVVIGWLGRLTGPVTVVLEATLYWAWLKQQLTAPGYTVQVAHLATLAWLNHGLPTDIDEPTPGQRWPDFQPHFGKSCRTS